MNNEQIEAMAESADYLFNNGMSRNFLYEILEESYSTHKWMKERLGLGEENNFRVRIDIPVNADSPDDPFIKFAKEVCSIKTRETGFPFTIVDKTFIMDDKKNKFKITRLLNTGLWKKLFQTKVGEEMARDSGKIVCCAECCFSTHVYSSYSIGKAERFVKNFNIWYGEQIKGNTHIILSCHPLDILRASDNCSFKTCYSPQGGHFNGIITSMLSPHTLIASVEEEARPGYKIGRSWIYVNETQIITARKYGGITDTHHLHIRSYLYSKMGNGGWVHRPSLAIGDDFVKMVGPGYLDRGHGTTSVVKRASKDYSKLSPVVMPLAICLFCGKRYNDNVFKGVCRNCIETVKDEEMAE